MQYWIVLLLCFSLSGGLVMSKFWAKSDSGELDWVEISLVKVPCDKGHCYHLEVIDSRSSQTILRRNHFNLGEAVKAFEALCMARELLHPEVVS